VAEGEALALVGGEAGDDAPGVGVGGAEGRGAEEGEPLELFLGGGNGAELDGGALDGGDEGVFGGRELGEPFGGGGAGGVEEAEGFPCGAALLVVERPVGGGGDEDVEDDLGEVAAWVEVGDGAGLGAVGEGGSGAGPGPGAGEGRGGGGPGA